MSTNKKAHMNNFYFWRVRVHVGCSKQDYILGFEKTTFPGLKYSHISAQGFISHHFTKLSFKSSTRQ